MVNELQSKGLVVGMDDVEEGEGAVDCVEPEEKGEVELKDTRAGAFSTLPAVFGTANVNDDSLSITFSFCKRERRSRRFSFSDEAASFLASRAATLSSN